MLHSGSYRLLILVAVVFQYLKELSNFSGVLLNIWGFAQSDGSFLIRFSCYFCLNTLSVCLVLLGYDPKAVRAPPPPGPRRAYTGE